MIKIIAIAGGSGSGKSTLAYGLQELFPTLIEVVHFDDYQKNKDQVSEFEGMKNWDHPDAIDFEKLVLDLSSLKAGKDVTVMTKSAKYNPDYEQKGRIAHIIRSKPIIIVEGYMALTNPQARHLYDYMIFLDLAFESRMKRRTKFINPQYTQKILLPMHQQYVEPTKKLANLVLNVENYTQKELRAIVIKKLEEKKIL